MSRPSPAPGFPSLLQEFFCQHLLNQRNVSPQTIASYRDTFRLLLRYVEEHRGTRPVNVMLSDLDATCIVAFLDHLEKDRRNCIRSRNGRLAGIRCFFRYVAAKDPASLPTIQRVLAIPMKRYERPQMGFLSACEIRAILDAPTATFTKPHGMGDRLSAVDYTYDNLSHLVAETLDPTKDGAYRKTIRYEWANLGTARERLDKILYPTGRVLALDYGPDDRANDRLSHVVGIGNVEDPSDPDSAIEPVVGCSFTAGGRLARKVWGDHIIDVDYTDGQLDKFGRTIRQDFVARGDTLHRYDYGYDNAGNRLFTRVFQQFGHDNDRSYLYEYDRLHRLTQAGRGALNAGNTAFDSHQPEGVVGKSWRLDVLGNFNGSPGDALSVVEFKDSDHDNEFDPGETVLSSDHHDTNATNEIVERTTENGQTVTPFTYDDAGNLIKDDKHEYTFDAWNRITEVVRIIDGAPIARYAYDALGRRIHKEVDNSGKLDTSTPGDFFYYDGHRVVEHHKGDGKHLIFHQAFVYGLEYIDELIAIYRNKDPRAVPDRYVVQDLNYNVVATTDKGGKLIQQFGRAPYGKLFAVEDVNGNPVDFENEPDKLDLPIGHQGLWHDLETGLVYNRDRYYSPGTSRFMQRDPNEAGLMIVDALLRNAQTASLMASASARGHYRDGLNLFAYLRGNPLRGGDPFGRYDIYDEVEDEWYGYRIAALEQLQAGAQILKKWSERAMGFAGGLLGFDLYESIKHIYHGEANWWDFIEVGMSLMPAAKILGKALTTSVRAGARAIRSSARLAVKQVARAGRRFDIADRLKRWFGGAHRLCRIDVMCFVAGTQVLLADGSTRAIEDIEVGDLVWAAETETGDVAPEPVVDTFVREADEVVEIGIDGALLTVTPEHPFAVLGKGWVEAGLLEVGDEVIVSEDLALAVETLSRRPGRHRVYNLEVWENHTYFAAPSDNGPFVLVHNGICDWITKVSNFRFRGAVGIDSLGSATHQQIVNAIKRTGSGLYPSSHMVMRLKHARTRALGIDTFNDFAQFMRTGVVRTGTGTDIGEVIGRNLKLIFNTRTGRMITLTPL